MARSRPVHLKPASALVAVAALTAAQVATAQQFPVDLPIQVTGGIADTRSVFQGDLATFVTIHIETLTPDTQMSAVAGVYDEKGRNAAVNAVADLPSRGWVAIGNDLRYDLRIIRSAPADGGWRVRLVTAQPIRVGAQSQALPYRHYPYGVLDLRLGADATGDGELVFSADLRFAKTGGMAIDPYPVPPLRLLNLRPHDR